MGNPPLIAIADLPLCRRGRWRGRGGDPVCRYNLLTVVATVLQEHLPHAGVITGRQVQPAQDKGDTRAVRHVIGRVFQTHGGDDLFRQKIGDGPACCPPNDHADDMGVDRHILPLAAGRGESVFQACGEIVQLSAKGEGAAHLVDVGIRVEVIFVKGNPAGHVKHVAQRRPVIGGAFQLGRIGRDGIVKRCNRPLVQQDTHQRGKVAFGDRPADPQIIGLGAFKVVLIDNLTIFQHNQGGHITGFDPVVDRGRGRVFGTIGQLCRGAITARQGLGQEGVIHMAEVMHDLVFGKERIHRQQPRDLFAFPQADNDHSHHKSQ